ncbi:DUF3575 domain-containing protein [Bacteroides congonensis]
MNKLAITLMLAAGTWITGQAQEVAVKTNLLYDATTTLNLGVEIGLGTKMTLDISGNYNPWRFHDYRLKHGLIQPELRYWTCEKFNGHFFGLHGFYGKYNVGGLPFNSNMRHNRYQGHLYGGGISYGYQWLLNDHWNLELSLGIGYAHLQDKKYPCADCGDMIKKGHHNYFGPTKAAVSIIYVIK